MCTRADTRQDVYNAFLLMFIGSLGGIVFGYALERIQTPPPEDWSKEDIKKAELIYRGEYPFFLYMIDNGVSIKELAGMLEDMPEPEILINMLYMDYKKTAGIADTQSLEQVKEIIERERRQERETA